MKLITYSCESRGREIWGQDVVENPVEWLEECTKSFPHETYMIVCCIDISNEEANRIDGALNGM